MMLVIHVVLGVTFGVALLRAKSRLIVWSLAAAITLAALLYLRAYAVTVVIMVIWVCIGVCLERLVIREGRLRGDPPAAGEHPSAYIDRIAARFLCTRNDPNPPSDIEPAPSLAHTKLLERVRDIRAVRGDCDLTAKEIREFCALPPILTHRKALELWGKAQKEAGEQQLSKWLIQDLRTQRRASGKAEPTLEEIGELEALDAESDVGKQIRVISRLFGYDD